MIDLAELEKYPLSESPEFIALAAKQRFEQRDKNLFNSENLVECGQCDYMAISRYYEKVIDGFHDVFVEITCEHCGFQDGN